MPSYLEFVSWGRVIPSGGEDIRVVVVAPGYGARRKVERELARLGLLIPSRANSISAGDWSGGHGGGRMSRVQPRGGSGSSG